MKTLPLLNENKYVIVQHGRTSHKYIGQRMRLGSVGFSLNLLEEK